MSEPCGKCGKAVYHAEKVLGMGKAFHRPCFVCSECGKSLDSSNVNENDGDLYCRAHYEQKFKSKGYGYGNTQDSHSYRVKSKGHRAATTSGGYDQSQAAKHGEWNGTEDPDKCPACGKTVYHAERVPGPNSRSFHRACLKCFDCGKFLVGGSWNDNKGIPYCSACYAKNFKTHGVGYGGAVSTKTKSPKR